MVFRLHCTIGQRTIKQPLEPGDNTVGADPSCRIQLSHPTVSRRHAVITVEDDRLTIEDLGSSNGTRVDGRRIREAADVAPGQQIALGSVVIHIEQVRDGDTEPALMLPTAAKPVPKAPASGNPFGQRSSRTTISSSALEDFTLKQLPQLLERMVNGTTSIEMAEAVGAALFGSFSCVSVTVTTGGPERPVQTFSATIPNPPVHEVETVERSDGRVAVTASFYPPSLATLYAPVITACQQLIALGDRRSRGFGEPRPPRRTPQIGPPPLPAPPTIEPAVRKIYEQAARVALGDVGVMIQGESGTGKEVLARYVHTASGRDEDKFIALNCAALPRDLLELELFGIEQAVATGVDARPGKFELADSGTLFLDEIGDMALETQAKILRVLQEQEVYRLGSKQPRSARVRVLSATNRDLDSMVGSGTFRADLYHRIAGWVVHLPALRDRPLDIPNLTAHFLLREASRLNVSIAGISQSAMDALQAYRWPGNIRELQREIARSVLFLGDGELLESTHLQPAVTGNLDRRPKTLKDVLEKAEKEAIGRALIRSQGDTSTAAEKLGIGRSTLYRRMKALGVQEEDSA
ncbi:MAG: sigma 54-interacting transcriptional regulator [Acidobacteriota bacterium]